MKKLFTLLLIVAPLVTISAQYATDTIYLTSGKYYICNVIDVNSYVIQYGSVLLQSQVERIAYNERQGQDLCDIIYLKSGRKLPAKVISEADGRVYYSRNVLSELVSSIHMGNGEVIHDYEFNDPEIDFHMEATQSSATASRTSNRQATDEPVVISRTVVGPAQQPEPQQPAVQTAQSDKPDQINLKTGNTIFVYIQTVGEYDVTCIDAFNQQYVYNIPIEEISGIHYANGHYEDMSLY